MGCGSIPTRERLQLWLPSRLSFHVLHSPPWGTRTLSMERCSCPSLTARWTELVRSMGNFAVVSLRETTAQVLRSHVLI